MMTKCLKIITFIALGVFCAETSYAKVCNLGDATPECDPNIVAGTSIGACSSTYKTCEDPRAGATYCLTMSDSGSEEIRYTNENCCTTLQAEAGYKECDPNEHLVGYGKSCLGAKSRKKFWEFCGCSYGFSETGIESDIIKDEKEREIKYEHRCSLFGGGSCKLSNCNTERRFFYINSGEHCKYRLPTRCGGFGCEQLYDCNHDTIGNDKEYYRNEDTTQATGIPFLPYERPIEGQIVDYWSNELDGPNGNGIVYVEQNDSPIMQAVGAYNLTNKRVCAYDGGTGANNDGSGLECNGIANYCYLWTGCNNARKWFNSNINIGVLYTKDAYSDWYNEVERFGSYDPARGFDGAYGTLSGNNDILRENFWNKVNPFMKRDDNEHPRYNGNTGLDATSNSLCLEENNANCSVINPDGGCTYITYDCHVDLDDSHNVSLDPEKKHRCWKRIACTEENRFYSSFINAALEDYHGNSNALYETSINAPYKDIIYPKGPSGEDYDGDIYPACIYEINACNDTNGDGTVGGGCYRKQGCTDGFEDIRDHLTIVEDWALWFLALIPECNDATACYKATACDLNVGAYSSAPNTSFFVAINSTATGLTCYRGQECHIDAGAYTSVPNTSFFFPIKSLASGSTCYRGQSCHEEAGAYSSAPNTSFFMTISSKASGSTAYRAEAVRIKAGAYTSTPNTSFFNVIESYASGSRAYRADMEAIAAGAYSSMPNVLFFNTIESLASGSKAYRADKIAEKLGAYSSTPNTSFFNVIESYASGSRAYRANDAHIKAGAYSSTPNTSFFIVGKSLASGSTAYRALKECTECGAYTSAPNTSFFIVGTSYASGSTAYRGMKANEKAGAYTSTPNTSFFIINRSLASGSTCYRGESCYIEAGAYTSSPNTSFFIVEKSYASGSICYRGVKCSDDEGGAYTESPNTQFFDVIMSLASHSGCYRGEGCAEAAGAYSDAPNTSFFVTSGSHASGFACFRGEGCAIEAGAYSSTPNTSFFNWVDSFATGSRCYRGVTCNEAIGAYSSMPNTAFFNTIESLGSSSICYRGEECAETANVEPNTSFFLTVDSSASGSICYRSSACNWDAGAYSSAPNILFFNFVNSTNAKLDSTCYRGEYCNEELGAYTSTPNTSFFNVIKSYASGSISYRADGVAKDIIGAYTSTPNTSFFSVIKSYASGSTAYRAELEHILAGAYSSTPNTSFFNVIKSYASGSIAYRADRYADDIIGAYTSAPNTLFFNVITSYASGSIAYRADHVAEDAYTKEPNTSFFLGIYSYASGSKAYRAASAHIKAGAYTSKPNEKFFIVIQSESSGSIAYRAESVNIEGGAYTSEPNTVFFKTIKSYGSGSISYRAGPDGTGPNQPCSYEIGTYCSSPNPNFFNFVESFASGYHGYRVTGANIEAGAYTSTPNTSFFITIESLGTGSIAYRAQSVHLAAGAYNLSPNQRFFHTIASSGSYIPSFRADRVADDEVGAYTSSPNTVFFKVATSYASGSTCYRGADCATTANKTANTSFFLFVESYASDEICYRSSSCNFDAGAYSASPNTEFFIVESNTNADSDSTCYRTKGCNIEGGAYTSAPNTSFFNIVNSLASGSIVYRATSENIAAGAYTSAPNTSFFSIIKSHASGSTAYRADDAHIKAGAYSSAPNTSFFNVIKSYASGSIAYRADKVSVVAYTSSPNTSFFHVISSYASGSRAYRGDEVHIAAGAYSSMPNTDFFHTISSYASGSISYRADKENIEGGAYSSSPNESFFATINSYASGSVAYRVTELKTQIGVYSSTPNTSFFFVSMSMGTGLTGYRGDKIHFAAGAYTSAPNTSFFNIIDSLASGNKSYRADKENIKGGAYTSTPNTSFFSIIKSHASGSTAYRGEKAYLAAGAYSSMPNTLFFKTISSYASGSISYRAYEVDLTKGNYTESPNPMFFSIIESYASGSRAYRADKESTSGAYTSAPNTSFFLFITSEASGSIAYRAYDSHLKAGAYTSAPNTSFFNVIKSYASGSISYRADRENIKGGAYTSTPNTSFFQVIKSHASGSTAYRAENWYIEGGAYSSTPNTSFFIVSTSYGSGLTSYRGDEVHFAAGAYSSSPCTEFFKVITSEASGIISYRAYERHELTYDREPNTSFFLAEASFASGSVAYRGAEAHIRAGAYTSAPNIDFFNVISSLVSDSLAYRADRVNFERGAYTSTPNTSFFKVLVSYASGSIAYRGNKANIAAGAYNNKPNTSYFINIESYASSDKPAYRSIDFNYAAGSYTSSPNTSFFAPAKSLSSGITAYRGDKPHIAAGAYSSSPNTSYFLTISSIASTEVYRAYLVNEAAGAYSSTPNIAFFKVDTSYASGSTCYRGAYCPETAVTEDMQNPLYFLYHESHASGSTCYRSSACNLAAGAYSSIPNTMFFGANQPDGEFDFYSLASTNAEQDSTCYRGNYCNMEAGAYTSTPNTSFFETIFSVASSSICYRGKACREEAGAYASQPSTDFFHTIESLGSITCYRADRCAFENGAYSSTPNTSFFVVKDETRSASTCYRGTNCLVVEGVVYAETSDSTWYFNKVASKATGKTCWRGTSCNELGGAYTSVPNTSFFLTSDKALSGSTCYRGESCNTAAGAYNSIPSNYFVTEFSKASGSSCYRVKPCKDGNTEDCGCNIDNGAFSVNPSTSFFIVTDATFTDTTCYRADSCHIKAGAYDDKPNTSFFLIVDSNGSGTKVCYRGTACNEAAGAYTSKPNTGFFTTLESYSSGSTCYRANGCSTQATSREAARDYNIDDYFLTISSEASGLPTCYRATACNLEAGAYSSKPNYKFFHTPTQTLTSIQCWRADRCASQAYTSEPNTAFFVSASSLASGFKCHRGDVCREEVGAYASAPSIYFTTVSSTANKTCYRVTGCNIEEGAFSVEPNTSFFIVGTNTLTESTCYRADSCNQDAGASDIEPSSSYFLTVMSEGSNPEAGEERIKCYRATACNEAAGAYTSKPNTSFFNIGNKYGNERNHTAGSICYRGISCNTTEDSATTEPNTSYFIVISSQASNITCYRATACNEAAGAYVSATNVPNSSFFNTSYIKLSGKTCFRATGCYNYQDAATANPDTSFFLTISSEASGLTCYRATACNETAESYSKSPNTSFFVNEPKGLSGMSCYRATACRGPAKTQATAEPDTTYFLTIGSYASGKTCYRASGCNEDAGSYPEDKKPNTSFFIVTNSTLSGTTCYRVKTDPENGDGSCNNSAGAYAETNPTHDIVNTSYFKIEASSSAGVTCYRARCHTEAGALSSQPNTNFFNTSSAAMTTPVKTCYRVSGCVDTNLPNDNYFKVVSSHINSAVSPSTCYRATDCTYDPNYYCLFKNENLASYATATKTNGDNIICTYATAAGCTYGNNDPNSSYFKVSSITGGPNDISCNYATGPNTDANWCTNSLTSVDTNYFKIATQETYATKNCIKLTVKRIESCADGAYVYSLIPDTSYFEVDSRQIQSTDNDCRPLNVSDTCYRATACRYPDVDSYGCLFDGKKDKPKTSGVGPCYYATGCAKDAPDPTFFSRTTVNGGGTTCYRATGAKDYANYKFTSSVSINTSFFTYVASSTNTYGTSCDTRYVARITGCASGASTTKDETYFQYSSRKASDDGMGTYTAVTTCYRATACSNSISGNFGYFPTVTEDLPTYVKQESPKSASGISCSKTSCNYGTYTSDCAATDASGAFFKLEESGSAVPSAYYPQSGENRLKCIDTAEDIVANPACHLKASSICATGYELTTEGFCGDGKSTNKYLHRWKSYYVWGTAKTCGTITAYGVTGCNANAGSYPSISTETVSMEEGGNVIPGEGQESLVAGIIAAPTVGTANTYATIFTEAPGDLATICNDMQCVTECSCNNANGWYSNPETAGGAENAIKATSRRAYARTAPASSESPAANSAPKAQICYHATVCPTGYYYYGDAAIMDTETYTYTATSKVNSDNVNIYQNCYKPECKGTYYFRSPLEGQSFLHPNVTWYFKPNNGTVKPTGTGLRSGLGYHEFSDPNEYYHTIEREVSTTGGELIETTDTIATSNGINCYIPLWPTHMIFEIKAGTEYGSDALDTSNIYGKRTFDENIKVKLYRGTTDVTDKYTIDKLADGSSYDMPFGCGGSGSNYALAFFKQRMTVYEDRVNNFPQDLGYAYRTYWAEVEQDSAGANGTRSCLLGNGTFVDNGSTFTSDTSASTYSYFDYENWQLAEREAYFDGAFDDVYSLCKESGSSDGPVCIRPYFQANWSDPTHINYFEAASTFRLSETTGSITFKEKSSGATREFNTSGQLGVEFKLMDDNAYTNYAQVYEDLSQCDIDQNIAYSWLQQNHINSDGGRLPVKLWKIQNNEAGYPDEAWIAAETKNGIDKSSDATKHRVPWLYRLASSQSAGGQLIPTDTEYGIAIKEYQPFAGATEAINRPWKIEVYREPSFTPIKTYYTYLMSKDNVHYDFMDDFYSLMYDKVVDENGTTFGESAPEAEDYYMCNYQGLTLDPGAVYRIVPHCGNYSCPADYEPENKPSDFFSYDSSSDGPLQCYKVTGCASDAVSYDEIPSTSYPSISATRAYDVYQNKYTNCNKFICARGVCNEEYDPTKTYYHCDTNYFNYETAEFDKTTCVTSATPKDSCHRAPSQLCAEGVNFAEGSGTGKYKCGGGQIYAYNPDHPEYALYNWGNSKTCAGVEVFTPKECNYTAGSHSSKENGVYYNSEYSYTLKVESSGYTIDDVKAITTNYQDIITETERNGCKTCITLATCNNAKGWYSSATNSAFSGIAESDLIKVTSSRKYFDNRAEGATEPATITCYHVPNIECLFYTYIPVKRDYFGYDTDYHQSEHPGESWGIARETLTWYSTDYKLEVKGTVKDVAMGSSAIDCRAQGGSSYTYPPYPSGTITYSGKKSELYGCYVDRGIGKTYAATSWTLSKKLAGGGYTEVYTQETNSWTALINGLVPINSSAPIVDPNNSANCIIFVDAGNCVESEGRYSDQATCEEKTGSPCEADERGCYEKVNVCPEGTYPDDTCGGYTTNYGNLVRCNKISSTGCYALECGGNFSNDANTCSDSSVCPSGCGSQVPWPVASQGAYCYICAGTDWFCINLDYKCNGSTCSSNIINNMNFNLENDNPANMVISERKPNEHTYCYIYNKNDIINNDDNLNFELKYSNGNIDNSKWEGDSTYYSPIDYVTKAPNRITVYKAGTDEQRLFGVGNETIVAFDEDGCDEWLDPVTYNVTDAWYQCATHIMDNHTFNFDVEIESTQAGTHCIYIKAKCYDLQQAYNTGGTSSVSDWGFGTYIDTMAIDGQKIAGECLSESWTQYNVKARYDNVTSNDYYTFKQMTKSEISVASSKNSEFFTLGEDEVILQSCGIPNKVSGELTIGSEVQHKFVDNRFSGGYMFANANKTGAYEGCVDIEETTSKDPLNNYNSITYTHHKSWPSQCYKSDKILLTGQDKYYTEILYPYTTLYFGKGAFGSCQLRTGTPTRYDNSGVTYYTTLIGDSARNMNTNSTETYKPVPLPEITVKPNILLYAFYSATGHSGYEANNKIGGCDYNSDINCYYQGCNKISAPQAITSGIRCNNPSPYYSSLGGGDLGGYLGATPNTGWSGGDNVPACINSADGGFLYNVTINYKGHTFTETNKLIENHLFFFNKGPMSNH